MFILLRSSKLCIMLVVLTVRRVDGNFLHVVHSVFCKGYGNLCQTLWYNLVVHNLGEVVCTEWEIARNCVTYSVLISCFVDCLNTNFKVSLHDSLISITMVSCQGVVTMACSCIAVLCAGNEQA
jgi:hypothetical protein